MGLPNGVLRKLRSRQVLHLRTGQGPDVGGKSVSQPRFGTAGGRPHLHLREQLLNLF